MCLCTDTVSSALTNIFNHLAQKNKATSYHLGQLKAKLAKLRRELISPSGGGGGGGIGFDVARTGVASVGFVGFPSVGKVRVTTLLGSIFMLTYYKSTLMSKLTGTHSEVSEIDFTTLTTVPGTLKVHGAPIQILDLREYIMFYENLHSAPHPLAGIIEGANDGRGRGRQGRSSVRVYVFFADAARSLVIAGMK